MSAEYPPQLEPEQKATWFAGLFANAGTLGFYISRTPKNTQVFPRILYTQADIDPLLILQNVFGGSIARTNKSFAWSSIGNLARDVHQAIAPYSPSKKNITAITQQLNEGTIEEKLQKVEASRNQITPVPHVEEYVPLVQDSQFMAGLFDAQAIFTASTGTVHIDSSNLALLEALKQCYGGVIGNLDRSISRWVATRETTQQMAQDVQDAVLLRFDLVNTILNEQPVSEDTISPYSARRLAYVMEDNGKMLFSTRKDGSGHFVAYPRIAVRSTDKRFLQSLASEFGGNCFFDEQRSRGVWSITGLNAARLALSVRPWSQRLPEEMNKAIDAFSQWIDEPMADARLKIALQFRRKEFP